MDTHAYAYTYQFSKMRVDYSRNFSSGVLPWTLCHCFFFHIITHTNIFFSKRFIFIWKTYFTEARRHTHKQKEGERESGKGKERPSHAEITDPKPAATSSPRSPTWVQRPKNLSHPLLLSQCLSSTLRSPSHWIMAFFKNQIMLRSINVFINLYPISNYVLR